MQFEENLLHPSQMTYIAFDATTSPKGKIPIATQSDPQKRCGIARRIGYTGSSRNDLALYRLKLNTSRLTLTIMLPGYYVLEHGIFRDSQQSEGSTQVEPLLWRDKKALE